MKSKIDPIEAKVTVIDVDILMGSEIVWHLARIVSNLVVRITLQTCASPRDLTSLNLSQNMTQESQARLMVDVLINVEYMR